MVTEVKQMFVPKAKADKVRYSGTNPKNYIVVHQTGNTSKGANAEMHARLQYNGNSRSASWHEQIDDKDVYQSFSHDDMLWHAGDGRRGKGNGQGIGVELCVNSDGDYNKTIENGVARVKQLMDMHNIPIENVINHHDCSGKWCPTQLLDGKNGITWQDFKNRVAGVKVPVLSKPKVVKPSSSKSTYSGSIVDYLNQQGINSSFDNRKNLAVEYGVVSKESDYKGTASQNTALLNAMINGQPKQEGTRKEPIQSDYKGNSVVDYLVSIGEDSSFNNRKKLAKKYGINNYTGTAKQNLDLLNAMRGGGKPKAKPKPTSAWTGQVLRQGDRGPAVRQLQEMLASHYFYPDKGAKNNGIDGMYGAKTKNAVERFQTMNGLKVDGIAGKDTYNKLK